MADCSLWLMKLILFPQARATLEILIPDFVKQTSEEKPVEGDELEVQLSVCCVHSATLHLTADTEEHIF